MRIPKSLQVWLGLALAGCAVPLSAQQAPPIEGIYQGQVFEVGTQLVLSPGGRFVWMLAYGSLDAQAEGLWTRESDGSILLNSDPPVVAPRLELAGRSRDNQPGIAIRLACESREAAQFVRAIVEHADGAAAAHILEGPQYRTEAGAQAPPVVAVGLDGGIFGVHSERVPVTSDGENVFTFRFIANDFGRADFRNQRVAVANGMLSFTWRDVPLRYRREGTAAGEALPQLPPIPRSGGDAAPAALDVVVGEPFAGLAARAGRAMTAIPGEAMLIARGPIDLKLGYDGPIIDFGRVEGGRQPLILRGGGEGERLDGVEFTYGAGLLTLDEALSRARALRQRLEQAGFGVLPGAAQPGDPPDFTTRPADDSDGVHAADWTDAARMLSDDAQGISAMELFTIRSQSHMVYVRLDNERRHERETCPYSEWRSEGGREWRLRVSLNPNLAPVQE